ncbi:MAG: hypothetical protein HRT67_09095 [Flavobacteriaceae bacterium]|nr:hypothetical protein [Flavobacteriaceae bacterium]
MGSYYPFGLRHKGHNNQVSANANQVASKFKYNGTEFEQALDIDLYEMPLRQYDPTIARWIGIDPVTHLDFSTYSAFDNNPIYYDDPYSADGECFKYIDSNADGTYKNNIGNIDSKAINEANMPVESGVTASVTAEELVEREPTSNSSSNTNSAFCDAECQLRNLKRKFKAHSLAFDMVGMDKESKEYDRLSKIRAANLTMILDSRVQELVAPTDPLGLVLHFGTLGIGSRLGIFLSAGKHLKYINSFKNIKINPFGLRGGYGVFGKNGRKIGNYRIDMLYANPKAGLNAGTIFSLKQNKLGEALFRLDYGALHKGGTGLHSTIRFYFG